MGGENVGERGGEGGKGSREEKTPAASAAPPVGKKKRDEPRKRKGQHDQILEDWSEFAEDERRHKKSRRKKVDEDDPDLLALEALDNPSKKASAARSTRSICQSPPPPIV